MGKMKKEKKKMLTIQSLINIIISNSRSVINSVMSCIDYIILCLFLI